MNNETKQISKKSVSAKQVLKSAYNSIMEDPLLYMCLVIPIYLFTGISVIFIDFIIINNLDYDYYRYYMSLKNSWSPLMSFFSAKLGNFLHFECQFGHLCPLFGAK